jgi:hypothetical protein
MYYLLLICSGILISYYSYRVGFNRGFERGVDRAGDLWPQFGLGSGQKAPP